MSNYEIEYRVNGWLDVEADTEEEAKAIAHNKLTSMLDADSIVLNIVED